MSRARLIFSFSVFYFFSVSFYAWILGFFPLYLKALGFSPLEISLTSSVGNMATIIGVPIVLQIAHKWIAPRKLLLFTSLAAVILFMLLFGESSFVWIFPSWFLCLSIKRGGDSLVDAQVLRESNAGTLRFEMVRIWGSLGFVLATIVIGVLFDRLGLAMILPWGLATFVILALIALPLKTTLSGQPGCQRYSAITPRRSEDRALYRKALVLLLLSSAFSWAAHAPFYAYYSIYLNTLGWNGTTISLAWNIGVLAEITCFLFFSKFERYLSLTAIYRFSLGAAVLRWLLIALVPCPPVLLFTQLLHGFSYGTLYISSLKLVSRILPDHLKDRGQGILGALGQGLGSLIGYLVSGIAASHLSSYADLPILFGAASLVAACGFLISTRFTDIRAFSFSA